jgi:quinol monooxygenase YgiN
MTEWLFFQVGHIGPMVGQLWYFKAFAPHKIPLAIPAKQAKKGTLMSPAENVVTVVWDTWLKSGAETEGLRLTRQVWSDMRSFDGYVSHQILIDHDAPGHIIALATWRSREDADAVREKYKDSETIRRLTPLLARPRDRWVTSKDQV